MNLIKFWKSHLSRSSCPQSRYIGIRILAHHRSRYRFRRSDTGCGDHMRPQCSIEHPEKEKRIYFGFPKIHFEHLVGRLTLNMKPLIVFLTK